MSVASAMASPPGLPSVLHVLQTWTGATPRPDPGAPGGPSAPCPPLVLRQELGNCTSEPAGGAALRGDGRLSSETLSSSRTVSG